MPSRVATNEILLSSAESAETGQTRGPRPRGSAVGLRGSGAGLRRRRCSGAGLRGSRGRGAGLRGSRRRRSRRRADLRRPSAGRGSSDRLRLRQKVKLVLTI